MRMQSSSQSGRVAYCLPIGISSSKTKCFPVEKGGQISARAIVDATGKDNSCVVQLHCLYSQLRCIRTFRKMFSCLRRSDRRESDGMGHVVCSKNRVEDRNQLLECRILYNFIAAQMRSCTFWHCIAIHYS